MTALTTPQRAYLQGYPSDTLNRVEQLIAGHGLGAWLLEKYAHAHEVRSDKALYHYVQNLKQEFLRGAAPVSKAVFDSKLHLVRQALGLHTQVSRVQGSKLKAKREIRIASLFKTVPAEFLKMIVVHELAHLREPAHDKAFYQLCTYMEPRYHQLEFELRLYLTHLEMTGQGLWGASETVPAQTPATG